MLIGPDIAHLGVECQTSTGLDACAFLAVEIPGKVCITEAGINCSRMSLLCRCVIDRRPAKNEGHCRQNTDARTYTKASL